MRGRRQRVAQRHSRQAPALFCARRSRECQRAIFWPFTLPRLIHANRLALGHAKSCRCGPPIASPTAGRHHGRGICLINPRDANPTQRFSPPPKWLCDHAGSVVDRGNRAKQVFRCSPTEDPGHHARGISRSSIVSWNSRPQHGLERAGQRAAKHAAGPGRHPRRTRAQRRATTAPA